MTRQELIEKIEAACQKANPNLLELEFGCNIRELFTNQIHKIVREEYKPRVILHPDFPAKKSGNYIIDEGRALMPSQFEILGKEPGLADILYALDDNNVNIIKFWTVLAHGSLAMNYENEVVFWNLEINLYGQPLKTLTFIYSLLFPK